MTPPIVLVLGGGPAGVAAALEARRGGAEVTLVESGRVGGACVHHACVPTNILLHTLSAHLGAVELAVLGVADAADRVTWSRAVARKDTLVGRWAAAIEAVLSGAGVRHRAGRARFLTPNLVEVVGDGDPEPVTADAFVIATGSRWVLPSLPGLSLRITSPDALHAAPALPGSVVVLGGGPSANAFAVEQAFLLGAAGVEVALVVTDSDLLPGLDADCQSLAVAVLEAVGVTVLTEAEVVGPEGAAISVRRKGDVLTVAGELIVMADPRQPLTEGLALAEAGLAPDGPVVVDRSCRTVQPHIFAAGDVAVGPMLSAAATRMGEVAGANAVGADRRVRLDRLPRVLHTTPEIAWVGADEDRLRASSLSAVTGVADLAANARSLALGARGGLVKVVADPRLREILGVHAVGDGAGEMVAVAAAVMQAEATVDDLAETLFWHPSAAESLAVAARRAAGAVPRP